MIDSFSGEAFDEDAWIFFIDREGTLHKNLISEAFEKRAASPSNSIVGRFISVTQVGDAAAMRFSVDPAADANMAGVRAACRDILVVRSINCRTKS